jgi:hypothetical protein
VTTFVASLLTLATGIAVGSIARKAGYSVYWGLAILIPVLGALLFIVGPWVLAYIEWPAERKDHAVS